MNCFPIIEHNNQEEKSIEIHMNEIEQIIISSILAYETTYTLHLLHYPLS